MPLLEIRALEKSYLLPDGKLRPVVKVDRFDLEPRSQCALRGESGSGKTTFLHLIAGIIRADAGEVRLDGCELTRLSEAGCDRHRALTTGYIFQSFNLLQGYTCLENVLLGMLFGPGPDRAFARSLLERVGLGQRMQDYPRQLSTGQQQRVAVARALASRPKLVLADEPTGNLDARNSRDALQLIREACRENGAALLLVSHDAAVLEQFEGVIDFHALNRPRVGPEVAP